MCLVLLIFSHCQAARAVKEKRGSLDRGVCVVAFSDEEGTMIGSKAMGGQVHSDTARAISHLQIPKLKELGVLPLEVREELGIQDHEECTSF